ncbi:hypothetical protein ACFWDI_21665 [Streptomyces sp. NPDC060064]|uniref:hypothetical protein n=1 Tax=Streptomyces sp. NPDC060064 TaxID=3347049 RepID=UPI00368A2957
MAYAAATEPPANSCWFRLPPGFIDLEQDTLDELRQRLSDDLALLHRDPAVRDHRLHEAQVLLGLLSDLYVQATMHLALGLHSDGDQGVSTSVLSLSDVPINAATRTLAAAKCGLQLATSPFGTVLRREIVDLPCSAGAALVTSLLPDPSVGGEAGVPSANPGVFQARLSVARPTGARVVLIDLTTTAVGFVDEYTEILLGIGRTVSFTDPNPQPEPPLRRSRLLEVLL